MRSKKYRPYIRRANGRETAEGLRGRFRLAFYQAKGKPFFVMVQHGFPNSVMECGATRRAITDSLMGVRKKGKRHFRAWARRIQKRASGKP